LSAKRRFTRLPGLYRLQIGKIRWDNELLDMLSEATGIPKISLRERIRVLAQQLGIDLPRWTREEVNSILLSCPKQPHKDRMAKSEPLVGGVTPHWC